MIDTVRLCLIGGCVLAIVFLTPDAGHHAHKSIFAVAYASLWSRFADWAAAWCSLKIVLLGIGALILVDAMANLAIRKRFETLGVCLLCMDVLPLLLCMFGCYELVKALL